jgi:hypothetical protein
MGRRNTGVKSLCRGFKLQGLTWPFVELTRRHSASNARNNDKRKLRGFADAELDRKRLVLKSLEEEQMK